LIEGFFVAREAVSSEADRRADLVTAVANVPNERMEAGR
jgi:hypothetical protein